MKNDKTDSSGSSGETSSRPPLKDMTEAQYLDEQARLAREAIQRVLSDMKQAAREGADPRPYVERWPWASMGVAAAVGFLAASAATPARGQGVGERLSSLFPQGDGKSKRSPLRMITTPLVRMARTAIVGALTSAATVKAHQNQQEKAEEGDQAPIAESPELQNTTP